MSTDNELIIAFVQGVAWWEWHKTYATLWQSDRRDAEDEAKKRLKRGTLGKICDFKGARK